MPFVEDKIIWISANFRKYLKWLDLTLLINNTGELSGMSLT
jgi:hypothetical protein